MKYSLRWLVQLHSIVGGAGQVLELMAVRDATQAVAAAVVRMPVERLLQLRWENFPVAAGKKQGSGPMRWLSPPGEACNQQISFAT